MRHCVCFSKGLEASDIVAPKHIGNHCKALPMLVAFQRDRLEIRSQFGSAAFRAACAPCTPNQTFTILVPHQVLLHPACEFWHKNYFEAGRLLKFGPCGLLPRVSGDCCVNNVGACQPCYVKSCARIVRQYCLNLFAHREFLRQANEVLVGYRIRNVRHSCFATPS